MWKDSVIPAVEVYVIDEPDRLVREPEELKLTGQSRTTRWNLAKEGRYPPKGKLGPWLSDVLQYCADPENYRYIGEVTESDSPVPPPVKVRKVRRRAVRSVK